MVKVDLHLHTNYSDGTLTPNELVQLALTNNLEIISITDHDCTDGIDEAMLASLNRNLTVIPGIELNTDTEDGEIHVLGYFIDYQNKDLQKLLIECRNSRVERARIMVERLNSLGINHDNFVSEKKLVLNQEVEKVINHLQKNKFVYKGKIKAPAGESDDNWVEREQLLFKSSKFIE